MSNRTIRPEASSRLDRPADVPFAEVSVPDPTYGSQAEVDLTYEELYAARMALSEARTELLRPVMSNVPEVAAAARAARRLVQQSIEQLEEVERLYYESGARHSSTLAKQKE